MKIAEYNEMMAYLLRPAQKETQVASLMDEYLGDQKEYQRAVDEGFQGTFEEYLRMKSLERKELAIGGFIRGLYIGIKGLQQGKIEKELIKQYRDEGMDFIDAITKGNQEAGQIVKNRKLKVIQDKFNETNVLTDDYVKLIDEEIKLNDPELFKDIRKFEKNNRSDLADKMRALRHPDWAEANFGEDYQDVLQQRQSRAIKQMMDDIDPNVKERTVVDDIDDMNQANIDEFFGRKKNADGGRIELAIGGGVIEGEDLGTREGFNVIKKGGTNIKTSQGFQPGNLGNIQALKEFQIKQTKEKNKKVKKFVELVEKGDSTTDAKNKVIKLFGLTRKKGSGTPPWMTEGKNILIDKGVLEETERGGLEIIGETEDFSKDKNIKLLSKETTEPGIKKAVYKNLTTGETFIKYKPLLRSNTVTVSGAGFDTLKQAQQTVKDYNKANPIKTGQTLKLEDDLRTLFNDPKIKPLLETGTPDKKYIKIAQNAIKGLTESQAEDKLKQLAEAVKPDGVYNIEGIDKINQNKANNIYKFFKSKDISRKIEDKAIGQSVGEGSIATPRADIQEELPFEGGTKTYSVDEAKAIKGSYRLGSKPYSIFGQIIDGRINQGAKMGMDAKLSQFEEGVQKAIRGEGKLSVKEAIDKYNAAATQFEKEINAYKSRGFRKITIPRISKEPPSKTIANKKAYKKYKKFFDKNFKELRYSFIIPKDLLPVPEIAAGMKDKKSPIYKRYFNDLKKAASEFIDNVNQYDEKELFKKIQKHPKFQLFRKIIPRLASLDMNLPDFSVFTPAMADEMAMFQTETPAAEEQNFIERNPITSALSAAAASKGTGMIASKGLGAKSAVARNLADPFKYARKLGRKALVGATTAAPMVGFAANELVNINPFSEEFGDLREDPNLGIAGANLLLPELSKKAVSKLPVSKGIQSLLTLGKYGRALTPIGLTLMGAEGIMMGMREQDRINLMRETDPEAYQEYLAEQEDLLGESA